MASTHPPKPWPACTLLLGCILIAARGLHAAEPNLNELEPLLKTYCYRCHGAKKQKGEINLQRLFAEQPLIKNREAWVRVIDQIDIGNMPPDDEKQPDAAQLKMLDGGLSHHLENFDCNSIRNAGRVTIHRLNNTEYDNTVRDLLGVDANASRRFPGAAGGGGGGFDNNADTLFLSAILMEKYLDAAEDILDKAIPPKPITRRFEVEKVAGAGGTAKDNHRLLETKSAIDLGHTFPRDGLYNFTVRAWGERSGIGVPRLTLSLNGRVVRSFTITAQAKAPRLYQAQVRVERGRKKVTLAFTNPHTDPKKKTKRQAMIDYLEVTGPAVIQRKGPSPSEKLIFPHRPEQGQTGHDAARKNLKTLLPRAFRRPVGDKEIDRFMALYDRFAKRGDGFEASSRMVLKAVLVHPSFLFRNEEEKPGTKGDYPIGEHELASRLSYFLWASMPDQTLFDLAAKKQLSKDAVLMAQIDRMLKDPKAKALSKNFALQWLGLNDLGTRRRPDRKRYPEFTPKILNAMRDETVLFFDSVVQDNQSLLTLLNANYTYLNEPLATLYGIKGVKGEQMRRVRLNDSRRGGILGMGSVLTVTSYPLRTSPVVRGRWILEMLLGAPPPPPAPDVGVLPEDDRDLGRLTLRKKLERHRQDPACAGCHNRMDPLGFGLENFDAIGRWRTQQNGKAIDATGTLLSGKKFSGPNELKKILARDESDRFVHNLIENMLSYALGRELEYYDQCAVRDIKVTLKKDGFKTQTLIREVVKSHPFRFRRNARPLNKDP